MGGQVARGLAPQLVYRLGRIAKAARGAFLDLGTLALNPVALLFGEQLGVAAGSPPRNGDTDTSVGADAYDVSPGPGMADEFHETITIVLRHGS